MAELRPYEVARALLIARIRKHGKSPGGVGLAVDTVKRYLTDATLTSAAQRDEDPNRVVRAGCAKSIADLENQFSSPGDSISQALDVIRKIEKYVGRELT